LLYVAPHHGVPSDRYTPTHALPDSPSLPIVPTAATSSLGPTATPTPNASLLPGAPTFTDHASDQPASSTATRISSSKSSSAVPTTATIPSSRVTMSFGHSSSPTAPTSSPASP